MRVFVVIYRSSFFSYKQGTTVDEIPATTHHHDNVGLLSPKGYMKEAAPGNMTGSRIQHEGRLMIMRQT
jgi:hypothetical protein